MTFTVEDGTVVENANSYSSVADADSYFSLRGVTTWTGTDEVKQQALVKATSYIDATYTWKGSVKDLTQSLGWPRKNVRDIEGRDLADSVPPKLKEALYELAVKSLSADLLEDGNIDDFVQRKKVDKIEIEYQEDIGRVKKTYPFVNRLLKGLYYSKSGSLQGSTYR